jgi:hypothetical protein
VGVQTTIIEFVGRERTLRVTESAEKVLEALVAHEGRPFGLEALDGWTVFVNPATIAFWHEQVEMVSPGHMGPQAR